MTVLAVTLSTLALSTRAVGEWSWLVTAAAGGVGLGVPIVRAAERSLVRWLFVTASGVALFVLTRSLWSAPVSGGRGAILVGAVAGIAEEVLFRRGLYGLLERWGSRTAVVGAAVAFGLVHVPMYGWKALPIDVGAGLVFGWQRWSSGSWTASAVTHALANMVQYL